jgi:hypothetical protein
MSNIFDLLCEKFDDAWVNLEIHMKTTPPLRDDMAPELMDWAETAVKFEVSLHIDNF